MPNDPAFADLSPLPQLLCRALARALANDQPLSEAYLQGTTASSIMGAAILCCREHALPVQPWYVRASDDGLPDSDRVCQGKSPALGAVLVKADDVFIEVGFPTDGHPCRGQRVVPVYWSCLQDYFKPLHDVGLTHTLASPMDGGDERLFADPMAMKMIGQELPRLMAGYQSSLLTLATLLPSGFPASRRRL